MLCPYLLISINELLISIISFNDINKYGLNVKTAAHSGGRPQGRRHDEGVVEARMSMAWMPGCRRHMCPKAPRHRLPI